MDVFDHGSRLWNNLETGAGRQTRTQSRHHFDIRINPLDLIAKSPLPYRLLHWLLLDPRFLIQDSRSYRQEASVLSLRRRLLLLLHLLLLILLFYHDALLLRLRFLKFASSEAVGSLLLLSHVGGAGDARRACADVLVAEDGHTDHPIGEVLMARD